MDEKEISSCLSSHLGESLLDYEVLSYLSGMLLELSLEEFLDEGLGGEEEESPVYTAVAPFLESLGVPDEKILETCRGVRKLADNIVEEEEVGEVKLRSLVSMSSELKQQSIEEKDSTKFLWGVLDSKALAMTNKPREASNDVKSMKQKRRIRKQEIEQARKEFKVDVKDEVAMVLPDYSVNTKDKNIQTVVDLCLDNGRVLLEGADLKIVYKRRYGLVGKNGVGKTTLLKQIASLTIPGFPRHLRVLHVRQELSLKESNTTVLQAVLDADVERTNLLNQLKENLSNPEELEIIYARLELIGAEKAESRAASILSGLQFSSRDTLVSDLSGGWRMRLSLAAALYIEPDVLLLDEPTNHLDIEAVIWLQNYLLNYKHTLLLVSHDRGFLNEVCTDIIYFSSGKLVYYRGNYDTYVKTSTERTQNQMRMYQAYKDKREHINEFIVKFRYNAKRASLVQSRIKAVEKMDREAPPCPVVEDLWRFSILNPEPLGGSIISIDDVYFGYHENQTLLHKVNFGVSLNSRIAILGRNGAGKSTLLNLIMNKLQPNRGTVTINQKLRIGHFTQHSQDKFDLHLSPIENFIKIFPHIDDEQAIRNFLGKFQIQGNDALKPMILLSGGQKSRVSFATLAFLSPHLIIMDEPTNHLDMDAIDALIEALQDFKGGLIVVSHDQFFISKVCSDELWVVAGDGYVTRFRGDFLDYKKYTLKKSLK